VLFYLDQNDFNRRARPLFLASFLSLVLGGMFCSVVGCPLRYVFFPILFGCTVWGFSLTLRTRVVLEPDARNRRKQRYIGLGGLMGAVFFVGLSLIPERFKELILILIPFLVLSLVFFALGYKPDGETRET